MDVLLDTNVLLYAISDDARLGRVARGTMADRANRLYFSAVSVWEVALKHGVNPTNLPVDGERFASYCRRSGALELPLSARHAALSAAVAKAPEIDHKDPFDRMLLAQAKVEGLMFMTCDKTIMKYGWPLLIDGRA